MLHEYKLQAGAFHRNQYPMTGFLERNKIYCLQNGILDDV